MSASLSWVVALRAVLQGDDSAIAEPGSKLYDEETKTWASQRNLKPKILVRPRNTEQLSNLLHYLNTAEVLDFGIRSGGIGSSSAKDILISLSAFDELSFDAKTETITIGAGQTWSEVDRKLEEQAPGYAGMLAGTNKATSAPTYIN